ncbi:hypothetical protein TrVE_jg3479 [Triparma verrucosa]|uniref:TOG domain-containing protein n=1 Tax=Triparma verrucosa TaxID=1606542 RepID=A0A9W7EPP4_9STRA|nr:hypothetical protein TrVE_jg3479 [Triparma verrucosa]
MSIVKYTQTCSSGNTKDRLDTLPKLTKELNKGEFEMDEVAEVPDVLTTCLKDNNSNVINMTLDCIQALCSNHSPEFDFSPHFTMLANQLSSQTFGDTKQAIREKCVTTSLSILPLSPSVSRFYEKLVYNNLSNKTNWRARATALQLFSASLPSLPPTTSLLQTKVGKTSLNLSIQLLADANQEVRSYALEVIISLYACEPQGVKNMLGKQKGGVVRPAMKKELEERFEEIDAEGGGGAPQATNDDQDNHEVSSASSAPSARPSSKNPPTLSGAPSLYAQNSDSTYEEALTPLSVYSERDLQSHLDSVSAALKNTDSDFWAERMSGLATLERLILGGAIENYKPKMLQAFKALPIGDQIEDLRSQITNQACKTIVSLAKSLGDYFSPFFEMWLPSLLHLCISGVRLMAMQGQTCLRDIMVIPTNGYHSRILGTFMSSLENKRAHPQQKRSCVQSLTVAYRKWNPTNLERINSKFSKILKEVLGAKDPSVREEARHCYWAVASQFPEMGQKLMAEFDSSTQRSLARMKSESDDKWNAFVQDGFSQFPEPVSPKREGRTVSGEGKEQKKKPPQKEPQQNNAASAAAAGPRRVASKQVKKEAKAEQAPARQVADGQAKENEFHLDQVLEQAASKHWATREECFKRITENVSTLSSFLPPTASTRFSATLASHIVDPHHRVATAALELALACMIDSSVAQILASHLPLLLPPILSQLVSTKTAQRALSNDCLNACRRSYDPSALASVLCSKFSEANDRVKPGMLELLAVIVPEAGDYLGVVINMRTFLQRLGVTSSVRPPPSQHLMGAVEGALAAMYHLSETVFVAALSTLPSDPQIAVKKILINSGICGDIEGKIAAHLRGEKLGQGTKPEASRREEEPVFEPPTSEHLREESQSSPAVHSPKHNKSLSSSQRAWEDSNADAAQTPAAAGGGSNLRTPSPAPTSVPSSTGSTDPVIKYMVRPPLSEEKLARDWMRDTPSILTMLNMNSSSQDQYAGMQQMVQLARQNQPEVWNKYFGQILLSLLEGIGQTGGNHPNQMSPSNGGGGAFANPGVDVSAIKHLYLQGVRALLKYQPSYFADYIEIVVDRLLQCSRDPSYEIVHTAERALENLVTALDATRCLKVILPYLTRQNETELVLSCVRTLQKFIGRIPSPVLMSNLQLVMPTLVSCFSSPNVDMRKSVVFCLVEAYFVLGDKLMPHLSSLNAAQLKLVTIYVERQQKAKKDQTPGGGKEQINSSTV